MDIGQQQLSLACDRAACIKEILVSLEKGSLLLPSNTFMKVLQKDTTYGIKTYLQWDSLVLPTHHHHLCCPYL